MLAAVGVVTLCLAPPSPCHRRVCARWVPQFVDGGHTLEVALADLSHFRLMANPAHNVVLLDDAAEGSEVDTAWRALVRLPCAQLACHATLPPHVCVVQAWTKVVCCQVKPCADSLAALCVCVRCGCRCECCSWPAAPWSRRGGSWSMTA